MSINPLLPILCICTWAIPYAVDDDPYGLDGGNANTKISEQDQGNETRPNIVESLNRNEKELVPQVETGHGQDTSQRRDNAVNLSNPP